MRLPIAVRGTSGTGRRAGADSALARRARLRRGWRSLRRGAAVVLGLVTAAGTSLVPVTAVAAAVAGVAVAAAPAAHASAVSGNVLVVLVNGESSAPEASLLSSAGYTVTTATPATLAAVSQSTFEGYAAVVIGDSSAGGNCSPTAPATSSLGSQWQPWVTGNVAVLGTAPELAAQEAGSGQTGADQLITDSVQYATAGYSSSAKTGTGLYLSLNCGYTSDSSPTAVSLLAGLPGAGASAITAQGGLACTDSGMVNTWEAENAGTFTGFTSARLASGSTGSWPSPGCPVREVFDSWPANFTAVAYDPSSNTDVTADFTASDGVTGQPYVLLGTPAPAAGSATLALTPSTGGDAPVGTEGVDGNPADPGLTQAVAGDPVNTENGDFTQDDTDLSIPTFGPSLEFDRTYDAQAAQAQEQTGTPGDMGYGWTDNWASSLTTASPIPGDIYALDGLAGASGIGEGLPEYAVNGQAAAGAPAAGGPDSVVESGGNVFFSDTLGNRVEEVAGSTGTQFGIAMTAGDVYTIAGSYTGNTSPAGTVSGPATGALLAAPQGLALNAAGDLFIAGTGDNEVYEVNAANDDISEVAGSNALGTGADGVAATSSALDGPTGVTVDSDGDVYIADAGNNRVQEVFASGGLSWGQTMTAGDVYTVAGSAAGTAGDAGDGGAAASALLHDPQGVSVGTGGLYIADTGNNRIQEVAQKAGIFWSITMTANDIYTPVGSATGTAGHSASGTAMTSVLLDAPAGVQMGSNLYIADAGDNEVQEIAGSAHTEFGISMTSHDVYTLAGSAAGTAGYSGNGGASSSALLAGPAGMFVDATSGNMWIADAGNNQIRGVSASTGDISVAAGNGQDLASAGDGGPAVDGQLIKPGGEIADSHGDLYVTDSGNNRVQEIAAYTHTQWGIAMTGGDVYTIAGSAFGIGGNSGGAATAARLFDPYGLAFDPAGNLLIADFGNDQVRVLAAGTGTFYGQSMTAGDIYTIAGSTAGTSGDGGPAASGLLYRPYGLAVDAKGDVYIADKDNNRIQEIYEGGQSWGQTMTAGDIYTVAGSPAGSAGDSGDGGAATSALLDAPQGLTVDAAGDLIISDTSSDQVRMVPAATGTYYGQKMTKNDIYTIAGSTAGTAGSSGDDGPAVDSQLHEPVGLALDPAGDVYIADGDNDRIQEIAAASGTQWAQSMTADDIYTVAGETGSASDTGDGGPADMATVFFAVSSGTDDYGDLYIGDWFGGQLREVTSATPATIAPAPGLASALYPAPGSDIGGTSYPAGITVTQPGGAQVTFYPKTSGTCAQPMSLTPSGDYCVLPQFQSASLTDTTSSGTITSYTFTASPGSDAYTYSATTGQLTTVTDTAGNTLTVAADYPAPGASTSTTAGTWPATSTAITCPSTATSCQTIISASGRALVIGSSASGRVTSVTDPMNRTWTYAYTGSDLTSVTDPVSNVTSYTYDTTNASPLLTADLLTITQPNAQAGYDGPDADPGKDTVNVYNPAGQVTQQTDPMGWKTTFSYAVSPATGSGETTVTDPDGNATVYDYDQGALAAQSQWTGTTGTGTPSETDNLPDTTAATTTSCPGSTDGSLLDTATFDSDGNQTTYCEDASGNSTSTTAPGSNGTPATTTTAYTADEQDNCDTTAEAASACGQASGPPQVAPGGVITPPSTAPPEGQTWTLNDTDGNQLYTTTGVYSPAGSYEYSQTTYQLFKGNSVTLNSTNITCTNTPPSPSLPCATINADGVVTQLQYNPQGDQISSATPDGNSGGQLATTTSTYDADGEQLTSVTPDGNITGANAGNYTTTTAYNPDGQKTTVTQGNGTGYTDTPRTTSYGYDGDGNQTTVEDARGYTTTTTYNPDDAATTVKDPDSDVALTCYDGDGNVTETVPPVGVAANSLTAASCPTSYPGDYSPFTKAPLASDATLYAYDADGDQTAMYTPQPAGATGSNPWETTTYTYDGDGNLLTTTAPATSNSSGAPDQVTVDTYNAGGQLASQTTGYSTTAASTVSYCYDPNGDKTSVVYGDGNAAPGSGVTYANGTVTGLAPCSTSSWTVTASPQASYQTTYSYDSAGELTATTTPSTAFTQTNGAQTTYTYDPAGNMLTQTNPSDPAGNSGPDGVTTTWTYTPLNKPATVSYSGSSGHSVSYTHDASGNQTGMTDGSGTSSSVYDSFGELTSAQNGAGQTVGYGYNADGQVTGLTYPLGSAATWATSDTVGYGYDDAGELTSVTDFTGHQISIGNTADGLPNSVGLGSTGDTIATTYDSTDSPSAITLKNSSSTLQSFTYSSSPAATVLSETDTPSSSDSPAAYTYDAKGRVTSDTPGSGTARDYGFDASDNLTTLPTGADGTYNDASELTSSALSGTTTTYTYNADGEQTGSAQGSTADSAGTWNGAQELATYDNSAADMTAATYDGGGLRTSSAITPAGGSAISQGYVWNTMPGVPNLLMDGTSAYIYSTSNAPAEQVNLSTGTTTYLVTDSLGSVRGTVSSSGALTGTTAYDAWGNPETAGGLTATTPFGYAGGYTDPTGLIYLINRYYQPSTGQFISVDPDVSQTLTPYAYAGDDPVLNSDPTGLWESGHCVTRATSGLKVQICLATLASWKHGRWDAGVYFNVKTGRMKETGAKSVGMNVCGEIAKPSPGGDSHCPDKGVVSHPRGSGPDLAFWSNYFYSGVPKGWNWVLGFVNDVWAESSSGHKTRLLTMHDEWVQTCQRGYKCVA